MKPPRFTRALALLLAMGLNTAVLAQSSNDIFQLIAKGDIEQARKITDDRLKSASNAPDLLFASALIADKNGQSDKATAMYLDLIEQFPNMMGPYNNLSIHYANAGDYKSAVAILEKAMIANDTVAIAYKNLTALYARQASAAYRKALNSEAPPAPLLLATIEDAGSNVSGTAEQPTLVASAESFIEQSLNQATNRSGNSAEIGGTSPQSDGNNIVIAAANAGVRTGSNQASEAGNTKPALIAAPPPKAVEPAESTETVKKPVVEVAVIEESKPDTTPVESKNTPEVAVASARPSEEAKKLAERSAAEKQALIDHVKSWANAWSDRDVDRYLSHYSSNFKPRDEMSLEDWKKQRYGRLRWREFIVVKPSRYSIELDKELATVNFNQYYKSERFEDTIRKTLKLRKENGQWRITQELL